ncbi:unnamed protein product [Moneuplotes crassus]|uniref:Uncharacterized protein n=1 Tax=Euplotes crassus TaxID=5936 RepID=A0AAD1ULA4_EUPCR|nr:unnamed protein product [Moneuplotes crassus]
MSLSHDRALSNPEENLEPNQQRNVCSRASKPKPKGSQKSKTRSTKSSSRLKRSRNVNKLQKLSKGQIETVPAQEIEDLFTSSKSRGRKTEKNVLKHWKRFIFNNRLGKAEQQDPRKAPCPLRNSIHQQIKRSEFEDNYGSQSFSKRNEYIRGTQQLGSKCPANPNGGKTSRPSSSFRSFNTDLNLTGKRIGSPSGSKTVRNSKNVGNCNKPPQNGKEKCSRAIKRRPKSSRQFLVKNKTKSSTKYRSDYFPDYQARH